MLWLIYGAPSTGKTRAVKSLVSKKAKDYTVVETDDLMMYFANSLNLFGYRKLDNEKFWNAYHQSEELKEACFKSVVNSLKIMMEDSERYFIVFTNLTNLIFFFDFNMAYSREEDVLRIELEKRDISKGITPRYQEWVDGWFPLRYAWVLNESEYITCTKTWTAFTSILRKGVLNLAFSPTPIIRRVSLPIDFFDVSEEKRAKISNYVIKHGSISNNTFFDIYMSYEIKEDSRTSSGFPYHANFPTRKHMGLAEFFASEHNKVGEICRSDLASQSLEMIDKFTTSLGKTTEK